jgi:trigger factor
MQVSVETPSIVERRMTVGIPSARVEPEIRDRFKKLARQTNFNGFRPGKVPLRVVEQRYGQKVRNEVLNEILHSSFADAVAQEKLQPIGTPTFDVQSDVKTLEQGLSYTVTFEVYPEIKTLHVDGLAVEKPVAEVSKTDIDTMLYRLRQQRRTWNEVDQAAATQGDSVIIDVTGTINNQAFKGHEVKQAQIILGENNFLSQEFEEKLVGGVKGEDREFDLTFPENHNNPQLAGQTVHFEVHISKVAAPQLPEIDVEFAKSFGVEDGNIESLRMDARHNMERELEYAIKGQVKQHVLKALLKANPIEVPHSLVVDETQRLLKSRQQEWQRQDLHAEMFKDEALERIKLGILVSELVSIYEIKTSDDKVRQMIEKIAFAYEDPDTIVKEYYADKQRLKEVEYMVLEDQVVDWLLDRAQLTEKQSDFYTTVMGQTLAPTTQVNAL